MLAFSLSKQIAGVSVGTDITYRKNEQLAVPAFTNVGPSAFFLTGAPGVVPPGAEWRPRGDVLTALVNAIAYFGKNPVFDSAALTAELNYQHLQKVTFDPYNFYYGLAANCAVPTDHGCPTSSQVGIAVSFEPKWFQALRGTDISVPMFWGQGLHGNSVVGLGDNQGQGSFSIGVAADMDAKYNFSLKYNGFIAKHSADGTVSNASLGKNWDRDWVSFTFKTTF